VRRGHAVTLFNRGLTDTQNRSDVEVVHGDRSGDLNRVASRAWDAVIDTCGYTPASVATSAQHLQGAGRYLFVSSVSVYDVDSPQTESDELPLAALPSGADPSQVTPETYGPLKVLCEGEVGRAFAERATVVRPGLIAGPYDPTDRFTYWPVRVEHGGRFLAPGGPNHALQYIDVRDVAEFVATLLERDRSGIYNAVTTPDTQTFGRLIDACIEACGSPTEAVWTSEEFLREQNVTPWSDLPLWIPRDENSYRLLTTSNARAREAGLTLRPLPETVGATLAWARNDGKRAGILTAGLSLEREAELLSLASQSQESRFHNLT
jgi:2'-hydroxyisoflavone reductase